MVISQAEHFCFWNAEQQAIIINKIIKTGFSVGWVSALDGSGRIVWIVEIRTTVFSWTPTRFPFHTGTAKKLTFGQSPIITVIGKAFWDVGHAPKDQGNRRKYMPDYAVWEIQPVMALQVVQ